MKSEDWKRVKVGQTLIYANTEVGVVKATVTEIDVAVTVTEPTYRKEYPWGLTAEKGTVRISYDAQTTIENLANLIAYSPAIWNALKTAYDLWQTYKQPADAYKEAFQALIQEHAAE